MKNYTRKWLRTILLLPLLGVASISYAQTYTTLATDATGDHFDPMLNDGTFFEYYYDKPSDSIWFKIDIAGKPPIDSFGINIVMDTDQNQGTGGTWWGSQNSSFTYDLLLTVWIETAVPTVGVVGLADPAGVAVSDYTNIASGNISIVVDTGGTSYYLGLKRTDITTGDINMDVIAAVGSHLFWNDDIPNTGFGTINETAPTGIAIPIVQNLELGLSPNPTRDIVYLNFESDQAKAYEISIVNLMGQLVHMEQVNASAGINRKQFNLAHLERGVYIVRLRNGRAVSSAKLILE